MKDWRSEGTKRHASEARPELTGDGAKALESSGRCHYGSPLLQRYAGGVGPSDGQDAEKIRNECRMEEILFIGARK